MSFIFLYFFFFWWECSSLISKQFKTKEAAVNDSINQYQKNLRVIYLSKEFEIWDLFFQTITSSSAVKEIIIHFWNLIDLLDAFVFVVRQTNLWRLFDRTAAHITDLLDKEMHNYHNNYYNFVWNSNWWTGKQSILLKSTKTTFLPTIIAQIKPWTTINF